MESKWKVLLADASVEFRGLLRSALEETEEFEVVASVGDGLEAARLVKEKLPDLVLMDMILPGLDGLGLLDQMAELKDERPEVIVVSQFVSSRVVATAVERGVFYYMPKPCEIESLLERMRQAMASPAQNTGRDDNSSMELSGQVTSIIHHP